MTRAVVGVELVCFEKIIDFKDNSQPTLAQVRISFTVHQVLWSTCTGEDLTHCPPSALVYLHR